LPAIARSSAWTSPMRVSASTRAAKPGHSTTASALRRSPSMGIGTSVRQRVLLGNRRRNRSRSARCALSRTGSPSGWMLTLSSRPNAAAIRAASSIERSDPPASMRRTFVCDTRICRASSRWLIPAASRVSISSETAFVRRYRPRRAPRSAARSEIGIRSSCWSVLTAHVFEQGGWPWEEPTLCAPMERMASSHRHERRVLTAGRGFRRQLEPIDGVRRLRSCSSVDWNIHAPRSIRGTPSLEAIAVRYAPGVTQPRTAPSRLPG
jgi:hypothetical protein